MTAEVTATDRDLSVATHRSAPSRHEVIRSLAFVTSALAVALFVLRVSHVVMLPVTYLIVPLLVYPLTQLAHRPYRYSPLDVVYLTVLVGGLGGVLVFSSAYPIGFGDVHIHLQALAETVVDGHLSIAEEHIATSFVGLYLVTTTLTALGGFPSITVARALPLITFPVVTLAFYHVFVSRFLSRREALLTTMLFVLNYGVFRFNVEYRTLNLSFLLVVLLLALFMRGVRTNRDSPELLGLYTVLTVGLVLSHFATTVMYLVLLTVLTGAFLLHRRSIHSAAHVLITTLVLFTYVAYVSRSLTGFLRTAMREFIASFAASSAASGGVGSGVVGVTYGQNMFLIEWTLRLSFVVAFVVFGLLWLRTREQFTTFVVISAVLMGVLTLVAGLTGFLLNPGRVLTFFAIPYSVAFAVGLLVAYRVSEPTGSGWRARLCRAARSPTARNVTYVVVTLVLVLVLVNTLMKFPVDSIGSPEPIRTPGAVDEEPQMHIDNDDLATRAFMNQYSGQNDERQYLYGGSSYSRLMNMFYEYESTPAAFSVRVGEEYTCDCGFAVVGERDWAHGKPVEVAPLTASRIYDNGATEVFELDSWEEDSYQWRRQLTAGESE